MRFSWKVGVAATGPLPSQVLSRPSFPSSRFAVRELGRQVSLQLMAIGAFGKRGRRSIDLSAVPLPGNNRGSLGTCRCREEWTMDSGCRRLARAEGRVRFILCNGIPSATRVHRSGPRLLPKARSGQWECVEKAHFPVRHPRKDGPTVQSIRPCPGGGGERGEAPRISSPSTRCIPQRIASHRDIFSPCLPSVPTWCMGAVLICRTAEQRLTQPH